MARMAEMADISRPGLAAARRRPRARTPPPTPPRAGRARAGGAARRNPEREMRRRPAPARRRRKARGGGDRRTGRAWAAAVAALVTALAALALVGEAGLAQALQPARRAAQDSNSSIKVTLQLLSGLSTYDEGERTWLGRLSTTKAAAAIIAAQHCQERNGTVVEELSRSTGMEGCDNLEFAVTSWDTRSIQSVAVKSYLAGNSQSSDPTNFVIGTSRSLTSLPVSILANVNKIPIISYWATSPDFDDNSIHEQFLRTIPSDSATAAALAELFQEYNLAHAGMLYVDDTYGDGFRESLLVETNDRDITLEAFSYREGDSLSIKNAINGLASTQLNVIFVVAFMADFPAIMDYFEARGMTGRGTLFIFSDAIGADELTQVVQAYPRLASILNATQVVQAVSGDDRNPVFDRLRANWPSYVRYADLINELLPGGANFSDPTLELDDDLTGDNLTLSIGEDLFTDSSVVESFIYDTAFAYDAVVSACRAACMSYGNAGFPPIVDEPGEITFDGEDKRPTWLQGDALVDTMRNTSSFPFAGASGTVTFDSTTGSRVPGTAYFKLRSVVIDPESLVVDVKSVGDWDSGWTLEDGIYFPPGDTQTVPLQTDLPPEDLNLISTGLRNMAFAMVGLVFALCLFLGIWVWIKRDTRVVRKAQPEFLLYFLLGICMAVSSLAAFAYPESSVMGDRQASAACNVFLWLLSIGTTVTASAIILKLYRIMRIFHNPSLRSLLIRAASLLKIMATLLAINVIFLLVPTIVDPVSWQRIVVAEDEFGNPTASYGTCYFSGSTTVKVCFGLLLAFHASLYVVGAAIAYKVRDIDSSFQEGKTLAVAVVWQFQLYLITAPIVLAVSATETEIKFLIICLAIFLANVFAALFVMGPKVHAVRYGLSEDPTQSDRRQAFHRGHKPLNRGDKESSAPSNASPPGPGSSSAPSPRPPHSPRAAAFDDDELDSVDEEAAKLGLNPLSEATVRLRVRSSGLFDSIEQEDALAYQPPSPRQQVPVASMNAQPLSNGNHEVSLPPQPTATPSATATAAQAQAVALPPVAALAAASSNGTAATTKNDAVAWAPRPGAEGDASSTQESPSAKHHDERWPSSGSSEAQINVA